MAHTPGPWDAECITDGAWEIKSDPQQGPWKAVCDVKANRLGEAAVTNDESESNARLIAAAPEMLEACKVALAESEAANDTSPSACHLRYVLRAAIAKAEGK
jgi:hypothetical protein